MPFARIALLGTAILLALSTNAHGATLTVTHVADPGSADDNECSLREALQAMTNAVDDANDCVNSGDPYGTNDAVIFAPGLASTAINLNDGRLEGSTLGPMRMIGPVAGDPGSLTIDAGDASRVMTWQGGELTLQNLTLANGSVPGDGGALLADSDVRMTFCDIRDNSANDSGGLWISGNLEMENTVIQDNEAEFAGAMRVQGSATLTNSRIARNSARVFGSAIVSGDLTLLNSAAVGNRATNGDHAGPIGFGEVRLTNSTVSGNQAADDFGGLRAAGPSLTLENSTISGNSAGSFAGGLESTNDATLINSTVSGNSAGANTGGMRVENGSLTLINSILAGNSAPSNPDLFDDPTVTADYSLLGTGITGFSGSDNIQTNAPDLAALADNGGPTQTMLPQAGSPAIDNGDNNACLVTDQRGESRPEDGDDDGTATCDIGAVEIRGSGPEPTPAEARPIPAMGTWALGFLAAALALLGWRQRSPHC